MEEVVEPAAGTAQEPQSATPSTPAPLALPSTVPVPVLAQPSTSAASAQPSTSAQPCMFPVSFNLNPTPADYVFELAGYPRCNNKHLTAADKESLQEFQYSNSPVVQFLAPIRLPGSNDLELLCTFDPDICHKTYQKSVSMSTVMNHFRRDKIHKDKAELVFGKSKTRGDYKYKSKDPSINYKEVRREQNRVSKEKCRKLKKQQANNGEAAKQAKVMAGFFRLL